MSAAVAIYIPLVLSFFTNIVYDSGRTRKCHTQLFHRPNMTPPGISSAFFSCNGPSTGPIADVLPFYAELQTDTDKGVFTNKVKLFFASESATNGWNKMYYKLNQTTLLLDTTGYSSEATVLSMVTEPDSKIHSPGGRFHFELENPAVPNTCTNSTGKLRLCAKLADGNTQDYCGAQHLAAAEDCSELASRVITGLLAPFFHLPMNQCTRFEV